MSEYTPELGQMAFGQPFQQFEVPEIWGAAFLSLSNELDRVMGNIHQERYYNPFENTGNRFDCPTFSAHAYSWGDDEQPWNFKWRDVLISWYKWAGRGMSANIELTPNMAAEMLDDCLAAIQALDTDEINTE